MKTRLLKVWSMVLILMMLAGIPAFAIGEEGITLPAPGKTLKSVKSADDDSSLYAVQPQLKEESIDDNEFVPGEVLVGMKPGIKKKSASKDMFPDLRVVKVEDIGESVRKALPEERISKSSDEISDAIGAVYLVQLDMSQGEDVQSAIEKLKKNPDVEYAEPNYISRLAEIPNDQYYNMLWGMPKISMPRAWDYTTGSSSVQIGVLDTGIDYTHIDLSANIDRSLGYYVSKGQYGIEADIMDYHNHGTHVAGTIGAVGNNTIGVVGVNWNTTIVPIKIAFSNTNTNSTDAIMTAAVMYASALNLPVINMSYSISNSQSFRNAVRNYNGLFIIAAGNYYVNDDPVLYPIDNDLNQAYTLLHALGNVIFVASTDQNDIKAGSSHYGKNSVALAAPGVSIISTFRSGSYGTMSGTSMASPHVAGAAALLLAKAPSLNAQELKEALLDSVDVIPGLDSYVSTGGRLNVLKALKKVMPLPFLTGAGIVGKARALGTISATYTLSEDIGDHADAAKFQWQKRIGLRIGILGESDMDTAMDSDMFSDYDLETDMEWDADQDWIEDMDWNIEKDWNEMVIGIKKYPDLILPDRPVLRIFRWVNIIGATDSIYSLTRNDVGYQFRVAVTGDGSSVQATTVYSGAVTCQDFIIRPPKIKDLDRIRDELRIPDLRIPDLRIPEIRLPDLVVPPWPPIGPPDPGDPPYLINTPDIGITPYIKDISPDLAIAPGLDTSPNLGDKLGAKEIAAKEIR